MAYVLRKAKNKVQPVLSCWLTPAQMFPSGKTSSFPHSLLLTPFTVSVSRLLLSTSRLGYTYFHAACQNQ